MMEQFVIIIALVLYWVFRGALGQRRRGDEQERGGGGSGRITDGDAVDDAGARALEALRRWEARQREREPRPPAERAGTERPGRVVPATGRDRAARPRAALDPTLRGPRRPRFDRPQSARREAYEAISGMLEATRRAPSGDAEVRTPDRIPRPPVRRRPDRQRTRDQVAWPGREQTREGERIRERARVRERPEEAPAPAAEPPEERAARVSRRDEPTPGIRPRGPRGVALLRRFERLPLLQRAVLYGEILGPPLALRDPTAPPA